jgi:fumarylacetoacetase
VTPEALEPFRVQQLPRPAGDPRPLPHLWDESDQARGAIDLDLEVSLRTESMRHSGGEPLRITAANSQHLYWTAAQMLCHHTSGGCNLRAGDLFGSGTISNASDGSGSLLELSKGGANPIVLSNGERRTFLLDGDEIVIKARAHRPGFATIGFGECRGIVAAS